MDRAQLIEANEFAASFYGVVLSHPEHGAAGRVALIARGLGAPVIESFGIGAAPDRWDGLLLKLRQVGQEFGPFVAAGLLKERDRGGHYDSLRNRLVFPIREHPGGGVVGFGARRIDDADEPKYLNSPASEAFHKSAVLYGLSEAASSIEAAGFALVVEGYTDVLACRVAGVENVVGVLGTAMTDAHASALRALCPRVVLLFDRDLAGRLAACRALGVASRWDLGVAIAELPEGVKDPDELVRSSGGSGALSRCVDRAADGWPVRFGWLRSELTGRLSDARLITGVIEQLMEAQIEHWRPIRRRIVVRQLAAAVDFEEEVIGESLRWDRRPRGVAS